MIEAIIQTLKKNLCQPVGIIYFTLLFLIFKFINKLRNNANNSEMDLTLLRNKKIRIDILNAKIDPFYLRAILHFLFVQGNGFFPMDKPVLKKNWNLNGRDQDYTVPENGILFIQDQVEGKIYIYIKNIHNPIHSIEIEFYFNTKNDLVYRRIKELILKNYNLLFEGINSPLIKKFILNNNEWILDIGLNPFLEGQELSSIAPGEYVSQNMDLIKSNSIKSLILNGNNEKMKTLICLEIAKRLNWSLFVLPGNIHSQMMMKLLETLPSKSVLEVKNMGIQNDQPENLDPILIRNFTDNKKNNIISVFSIDPKYRNFFSNVPGFNQRISNEFLV